MGIRRHIRSVCVNMIDIETAPPPPDVTSGSVAEAAAAKVQRVFFSLMVDRSDGGGGGGVGGGLRLPVVPVRVRASRPTSEGGLAWSLPIGISVVRVFE